MAQVVVHTSDIKGAGTDANVFVDIKVNMRTEPYHLPGIILLVLIIAITPLNPKVTVAAVALSPCSPLPSRALAPRLHPMQRH